MLLNFKEIKEQPIINIEEIAEMLGISSEKADKFILDYRSFRMFFPEIWRRAGYDKAMKLENEIYYIIASSIYHTSGQVLLEEVKNVFKKIRPKAQPLEILPKIWLSPDRFEFDYLVQFDTNVGLCYDTININDFARDLVQDKIKILDKKLGLTSLTWEERYSKNN